jgi:hypothetical protein
LNPGRRGGKWDYFLWTLSVICTKQIQHSPSLRYPDNIIKIHTSHNDKCNIHEDLYSMYTYLSFNLKREILKNGLLFHYCTFHKFMWNVIIKDEFSGWFSSLQNVFSIFLYRLEADSNQTVPAVNSLKERRKVNIGWTGLRILTHAKWLRWRPFFWKLIKNLI